MELKRTLLLKRGISRAVSLVKDLRSKRLAKNNMIGELEMAKRNGAVYEQTEENGVIRIRMFVKKCDLEKLIYNGDDRIRYNDFLVHSLVEQRLRQLRKKHHAKVVDKIGASAWTPVLRSIPEEF
ncbi:hypothetical protein ARALYDRAFT_900024 [Arabidopsis lyrata subsp. lyrata]|uniref:Uncharacterized protein n=1 Tax=Arabidopsis lyrata subsp. lyrata TaxID=81972 RepID=D7L894_ARALL|nr:hypothetical protein ARALYDRAFT_900024 [Arabidopsis lyrata subsp. lyrata]